MRFPEDESDVFTPSNHPRRRPTISRKRKTSEAAEDHADSSAREDAKKKEPVAADTGENSCSFIEFGMNRSPRNRRATGSIPTRGPIGSVSMRPGRSQTGLKIEIVNMFT